MKKMRIGISSCLTGAEVRYDARHKLNLQLYEALKGSFELLPICPEVEYGLPVPREPMELVESESGIVLVSINTKTDHTEGMRRWTSKRLDEIGPLGLCGFIFKAGSPSCGLRNVNIFSPSVSTPKTGRGIFAASFVERFRNVPVADETDLQDPVRLQKFIDSVAGLRKK